MSPTQLSLKAMRSAGFTAEVTEKWNPYAKIRQDLFGFVDILCVRKSAMIDAITKESVDHRPNTVAVQTTSRSNLGARVKKIQGNSVYHVLKGAGWGVEVHGWQKNKTGRWECKIQTL